jgi:type IV secretory pathway VirB4 component
MFENHRNGLNTWIYIDEFYLLLRNNSAALFLQEIWKTARKWKCVPTGIMQNTDDLLNSPITKGILNNTNFVTMLSLPKMDRANLNDLLQIPQSQLTFITNSAKGHGLIYTGDTILPFNNEYPNDTELYRIMQTTT